MEGRVKGVENELGDNEEQNGCDEWKTNQFRRRDRDNEGLNERAKGDDGKLIGVER